MRQGQDGCEGLVIAAGGVSLRKAVRALSLGRRGRSREAESSAVAYQDGIGALVFVMLLSSAVELVLVDVLLSVLWMRLLALNLGLLAVLGLLSFVFALRAYPHRVAQGARALRWAGPLVVLVEIVLVTTGLLDWRIAAGVIAMTEGALTVLGIAAGAALVSQYRRCRAVGRSRSDSLSEAFFFLMPTPMAGMVRKELSFVRVLALALVRRTEGGRPGDEPLGYGGVSRKALLGLALLLLAAGTTLLIGVASGVPWIVLGFILLYVAVLTAAVGLASKVRPHVLRGDSLLAKWGLHHELAVPLGSVRAIEVERPQRGRRRAGTAPDRFPVPAPGRGLVVLRLHEPIAVTTRLGRHRLAETILLPVDEAGTAAAAIAARPGIGVEGLPTEGTASALATS